MDWDSQVMESDRSGVHPEPNAKSITSSTVKVDSGFIVCGYREMGAVIFRFSGSRLCGGARRTFALDSKFDAVPKGASQWPLLCRDALMNRSTASSSH